MWLGSDGLPAEPAEEEDVLARQHLQQEGGPWVVDAGSEPAADAAADDAASR